MINMVVRERGHGKVAVVVVRLIPDVDALLLPDFLCRSNKVFW